LPSSKNIYSSSFNSFGQIGLIQTPSAESRPEGSVSLIFNKNDMWKYGTLSVSPFNWLEASYFYYRPSDLIWEGDSVRGHYLDKGFNVKFIYRPINNNLPNIAFGLDDFAGTGFFSKEYIVSTMELNNLKTTFGIGWGKFANKNTIENPFSFISDSLSIRPSKSKNQNYVGKATYDQWFRGDVSIFGGIEYAIPSIKGLKLKIEYDPFNYFDLSAFNRNDALYSLRNKESDINYGFSYSVNKFFTIDTSYIKGNTVNFNFTYSLNFNKGLSKEKFNPKIQNNIEFTDSDLNDSKDNFYRNLLNNLNNNKLLLQTATLNDNGKLDISISTSDHRNAIRSSSYAASISNKVAKNANIDLSLINVRHLNGGIQLNNISYLPNHVDSDFNSPIELAIRYTSLNSGHENPILLDEFQPIVNFPVIFSSISPTVLSHIGNPEKFYFGGINLQHVSEIQFSRNLLLSSEVNIRVYDNFQNTISGPGSKMEHVRTDLVQYLKEDDPSISRMQLDFIWSPYKNIYAKISGGIYEQMFGGFGGEIVYKPFNKNFNIGLELFHVKQRAFNQRFNFKEYETTTGHLNFGYRFAAGIETNLSFGRYLAKDDGYTFDIGRSTKSGFKAGIYFTRTNVSPELFGEGSFDKGFYFQIPLDLFSNEYKGNYSTFKIAPLTRDGGAKLIHAKDLKGFVYNSTFYELSRQWDGFLN
jgi:hypothetical protein